MAEAKRQNAAGKVPVATPNVAPVSLETALNGAIGARYVSYSHHVCLDAPQHIYIIKI